MTRLAIKMTRAFAGLAALVAVALATVDSAFANGNRSSVFQLYHDDHGRAYVVGSNNLTPIKIYIDEMSGVRDLGNGTVMLPFNNGTR